MKIIKYIVGKHNVMKGSNIIINYFILIRTFCKNPSDYGFPRNYSEIHYVQFHYGIIRFDSIFYSFFTVFHFVDVVGWSAITYTVF